MAYCKTGLAPVLLAFHLCRFISAVLIVGVPLGQDVEFDCIGS